MLKPAVWDDWLEAVHAAKKQEVDTDLRISQEDDLDTKDGH